MTAVRRPYLAAATATLAALPPRYLPKLSTWSSPTPTCCGYRSTPMRPIVSTSKAVIAPLPGRFTAARGNAVCLRFYARVSDRSRVCLDIFTYASTNNGLIWSIMGSLPTSACPLRERAVREPIRHAHPGGPEQPGPPLLPGRAASGKHDRVRRATNGNAARERDRPGRQARPVPADDAPGHRIPGGPRAAGPQARYRDPGCARQDHP